MQDQAAWGAWTTKLDKMGFYNHAFMPTGQSSDAWCVWEVREDVSAADFAVFIDFTHLRPTVSSRIRFHPSPPEPADY